MKLRRWPRAFVVTAAVAVGAFVFVGVTSGTTTPATRLPAAPTTGVDATAGPDRPSLHGRGSAAGGGDLQHNAHGGSEAVAGDDDTDPMQFRLSPIDGTTVRPDARDFAVRTTSTGPLLLFLPATGHVPNNYRRFLTVAGEQGYHVLGLDFWNQGKSVAKTCGVDPRCYTQVQRNRFNGSHYSQFSKVDEANSVLSRMQAALDYLVKHDPKGGWGQYTQNEQVDWDDVVVAGHSQGGGEAAYIAHRFRVMGQLTFSSPIITDADIQASWLSTPGKTPTSVMYAFDDTQDEYYSRIVPSWDALDIPKATLTAAVPVPKDGAVVHRLISTRNLGNPRQAHLQTVVDWTPSKKDGDPVYQPVWKYMLKQVYPSTLPTVPTQIPEQVDDGH